MHSIHCGSWLASNGGITADQFLTDAPGPNVGASLLAMAVCYLTDVLQIACSPCGCWLASDGGITTDQFLTDAPGPNVGASLLAKTV